MTPLAASFTENHANNECDTPEMKKETPSKLKAIRLAITVFLCGSVVMVIELLGTRIIAPVYGTSLYVWSSLITVTMVALSLGYFLGGKIADQWNGKGLRWILILDALFILLIPAIKEPILIMTDPLGMRLGSLISATLLFLPPLTGLGMVSPFALKSSSHSLETVGSTAGRLYAISTLGSVAGTLLLGFFLFPLVGIQFLLMSSGLMLLAGALILGPS
jgi:predicted membrane-bound spermidine synthase